MRSIDRSAPPTASFVRDRSPSGTAVPTTPPYHGVSQDFGFYNAAIALLLVLAAIEPTRSGVVMPVAIALNLIHGITHVFRYSELYYGDGTRIPTRPQAFEMRDGLQLLAAATGMVLFFPLER